MQITFSQAAVVGLLSSRRSESAASIYFTDRCIRGLPRRDQEVADRPHARRQSDRRFMTWCLMQAGNQCVVLRTTDSN